MGEATLPYGADNSSHINYTSVAGFFLQDDPSTDASTFDYTKVNLGLINRTYPTDEAFDPAGEKTQWQRFANYVSSLNRNASSNVQYKVLIMGRHGQGDHNVAESFYGTAAWDCHWSLLDGNDTVTWADAHLTQAGIDQALVANTFWRTALATAGIPAPQTYYVSPLARCLATANLTFTNLPLPTSHPYRPIVKELLRETLGLHTCDRRSSKTWITQNFPDATLEPGFAEDDPLWDAQLRESATAQTARLTTLLNDIFTTDKNTFLSLTSHSGSIRATLRALAHRDFALLTGAVIPVLVRAETRAGPAPPTHVDPPTTAPTCEGGSGA